MKKKKKLGLALGSGGARGFSHIGVIKVLKKHNIKIDTIAGTSMGAMVAAYYAYHGEITTLEQIALNWKKRDTLTLVDLNNPKISLVKGKKIREWLKTWFGDATFKDTKIKLAIGATSLNMGKEFIFKKGLIRDAVMASGTFPNVFPPFPFKNDFLIDGGVANPTPVDLADNLGADVIVAVDLFNLHEKEYKFPNAVDVLIRTNRILLHQIVELKMKSLGKQIILLAPETGTMSQTFEFHKAKQFIKAGEEIAEKNINKIKRMLR